MEQKHIDGSPSYGSMLWRGGSDDADASPTATREPATIGAWTELVPPTCPVQDGRYCRSTCAWWMDGSCAAVVMATALHDVAKNGIEAVTYPN